jgi:hypothetical protein
VKLYSSYIRRRQFQYCSARWSNIKLEMCEATTMTDRSERFVVVQGHRPRSIVQLPASEVSEPTIAELPAPDRVPRVDANDQQPSAALLHPSLASPASTAVQLASPAVADTTVDLKEDDETTETDDDGEVDQQQLPAGVPAERLQQSATYSQPVDEDRCINGQLIVELVLPLSARRMTDRDEGDYYYHGQYLSTMDEKVIPPEFSNHGISIDAEDYKQFVRLLAETSYVRCGCCCSGDRYRAAWFALLIVSVPLAYILGWSFCLVITQYNGGQMCAQIAASVTAFTVLLVWMLAFIICCYHSKKFVVALQTANNVMKQYSVLVCCRDYGPCYRRGGGCSLRNRLTILCYSYNWQDCQMHLEQFLADRSLREATCGGKQPLPASAAENVPLLCEEDDDYEDEPATSAGHLSSSVSAKAETADELLIYHSTEYGKLLVENRLLTPSEQRHTSPRECLCQFVESLLVDPSNVCSTTCRLFHRDQSCRNCCFSY